jgi:DNA adenine methylase
VAISCEDFADALASVSAGALVYCDPVYALPDSKEIFKRYSAQTFSWRDQERLAEIAHELQRRGAFVVISNSADARVAKLYRGSVSLSFSRRVPLPRAGGTALSEAVYILCGRAERNALRQRVGAPTS